MMPADVWHTMKHDLLRGITESVSSMFLFGLVIGSFLGTVVIRLPIGKTVIWGRSRCDHCGKALCLWQLIPVIGWIIQCGRCYFCNAQIPRLYLVMELGAASVFLWSSATVPPTLVIPSTVLGLLLLTLGAMDWCYLVLSDLLVMPLLILGLLVSWLYWPEILFDHVLGVVVGAMFLLAINAFYRFFRHCDGLGMGDVKLLGAAGAWLGWSALPSVLAIASASALLVVAGARSFGVITNMKQKIAFGSYLCFSIWIVWLYGPIWWM